MNVDLMNYTGVREKKEQSIKHQKAAEEQRAKREESGNNCDAFQGYENLKSGSVSVTFSKESQEYMSHVEERKAAQAAEKERLRAENDWSPFSYMGDLSRNEPTQYLVFSKHLYDKGFFDGMDAGKAGQIEDMLKNITSGMDSINGMSDAARTGSSMSHEAAKLDLISSVNALHYFADTYLSGDLQSSFKELVKEYERYNGKNVANHRNGADLYSESMKDIPAPNAVRVSADVKQLQERTKAYQQIGKVKHTAEEEKELKNGYQALFEELVNKKDNARNIFDSLQDMLVNYAAGGSKNSVMLSLLNANNAGSIDNMFRYWSALL